AYVHQDVPFEKLVEELQPPRDLSRHPLFQVMFILQNAPLPSLRLKGLSLVPLDTENETAKFDLTLSVFEGGDGALRVNAEYNRDLFDCETIDRMLGHFETLLGGVVADPTRRLSQLPLLGADERRRLLVEWNDTSVSYAGDECLHSLVERQAERTPGAVAVVYQDRELTYGELNGRANQLAHHLRELGVGPDVLVGVCAERSVEMVVGLLGILKAGGAYVPLDPSYPAERLAFMLRDAGVGVLLTQEHLAAGLPAHDARLVRLDADWAEIALRATDNPAGGAHSDNLAYMIYTSGSTGRPKGAMNTHGAIRNRLLWMQDAYRLTAADRVLQKTPFSFDVSVWEFFWPLLAGAQLVVAAPGGHQDGGYLVRLIRERRITVLHFVPSMLQLFVEEEGLELCDSLRMVICSGEALPFELQERFFERSPAGLHNLYGPTEAAVDVTFWECERAGERRTVPIGRPVANTQIYILDPRLEPAPVGAPGELYIGGEGLARGYLRRAGMTGEKFLPHPFSAAPGARLYRTGDLARFLPDGNVEYLSRIDDQVKLRGFRIELGEIEAALAGHAGVREVAVAVRAGGGGRGDKRLAAYVVPAAAASRPTVGELRSFLKERLPEYMIPSSFTLLESMPLTPSGKVDRKALPRADASRPELEAEYVTPQTELQQGVAAVWREVLGLEQVGIHDNFFDLGGHSLLLAQVLAKLRDISRREITMLDLFRHTTVDALASFLAGDPAGEAAPDRGRDRGRTRKESANRQRQQRQERQAARGRREN
ncbi:MAG: amino acid adenylation domain-containing protein, partial [Acidobacteria bacterium]|nr:amino acid adenylation domain-containing protein [Acidobacteriota bacterium]